MAFAELEKMMKVEGSAVMCALLFTVLDALTDLAPPQRRWPSLASACTTTNATATP